MNFSSLADIAGLIVLIGVLGWLRRKYREAHLRLWMVGVAVSLLEPVATVFASLAPSLARGFHTLGLDAIVLAGLLFAGAARQDVLAAWPRVPILCLPALPLLALMTLLGLERGSSAVHAGIALAGLLLGIVGIRLLTRSGRRLPIALLGMQFGMWAPMAWLALRGRTDWMAAWGLASLYVQVAMAFRNRVHRDGIGGVVVVAGFTGLALFFLLQPLLPGDARSLEPMWTVQIFVAGVGLLLLLLEDQVRRGEQEAMHDVLTGLPNRRLFDDRLTQALERARRTGRSTAVFVIDLNHFKQVNDTLGHRTGDRVLALAGQALKNKIRSSDTLARCGGDEFNVIVNDLTRREDCERIAEAIRSAVAAVVMPPGIDTPLGASIGYALFPDDVADAAELCELADIRMYLDKRKGIVSVAG